MVYIEDGNCDISNNLAENSIRPFTVGRKRLVICMKSKRCNSKSK
ncbi:transposase [Tissierella sp. MB52-C2]